MFNFDSVIVLAGLLIAAFELHQGRKGRFIEIALTFKERYDHLNEARQEFYYLYTDDNSDLHRLKQKEPETYKKLIHWETRYFWYVFNQWQEGHIRRSIPKYLKRDWDYVIKSSMKNRVHKQAWDMEIRKIDFLGYGEFYKFIDQCVKGHCGKE